MKSSGKEKLTSSHKIKNLLRIPIFSEINLIFFEKDKLFFEVYAKGFIPHPNFKFYESYVGGKRKLIFSCLRGVGERFTVRQFLIKGQEKATKEEVSEFIYFLSEKIVDFSIESNID
jgi:hypothetical protein